MAPKKRPKNEKSDEKKKKPKNEKGATKKKRKDDKRGKKKMKKPKKEKKLKNSNSKSKDGKSSSSSSSESESSSDLKKNEEVKEVQDVDVSNAEPLLDKENFVKTGCEVCENLEDVRIILRKCGHVICLPCILEWLKNKIILEGLPRMKCPVKTCIEVIHENDINAVFDEKEPALEVYMPIEHRRYLQHKQNKHSIYKGIPSDDIKRCPLCKAVYVHEPGCNFVICANSACNTNFCWTCEIPIGNPTAHFTTASTCRLGYLDYQRLLQVLMLVLDVNFILLWLFLPFIYLVSHLYIPVIILVTIPICMAHNVWQKAYREHDYLIGQEIFIVVSKMIVVFIFGIIIAIPISLGSILSGFTLTAFYTIFCFLRTIPCGCASDRVSSVLCVIRWIGRLFRIGPYGKLLDEARKERRNAMIKVEDQNEDFEDAEPEFSNHQVDESSNLTSSSKVPSTEKAN